MILSDVVDLIIGAVIILTLMAGAWVVVKPHRRQAEDTSAPSLASAYAEKRAARRTLKHQWDREYNELVAQTLAVECTCPGVHPHSYGACAIHTIHPTSDKERVRIYQQILTLIDRIRPKDPTTPGCFSYQEGPLPLGTMTSRELADTEGD